MENFQFNNIWNKINKWLNNAKNNKYIYLKKVDKVVPH